MKNIKIDTIDNNIENYIHIHAFDLLIFIDILKKIDFFMDNFNIIITSSKKEILDHVTTNMQKYNIFFIFIDNVGMDSYGKAVAFEYLSHISNLKWVLCLHTKTNKNWRYDLLDNLIKKGIINDIRENKIDKKIKMIGSINSKTYLNVYIEPLNDLISKLNMKKYLLKENDPNDIDYEYYYNVNMDLKYLLESYDKVKEHYKTFGKNEKHRIFNKNQTQGLTCYGEGSFYWIEGQIIKKINNISKYIQDKMINEGGYIHGDNSLVSYTHAFERLPWHITSELNYEKLFI
jgi:hypothetical protein